MFLYITDYFTPACNDTGKYTTDDSQGISIVDGSVTAEQIIMAILFFLREIFSSTF